MVQFVKDLLKAGVDRYRAFFDSGAWLLLVLGVVLFSLQTPFMADGFVNLPVVATVLQGLGLTFSFAGLSIMISVLMFPQLHARTLWVMVSTEKSLSAAIALVGLLLFNGLILLSCVLWATNAFSLALTAGR